MFGEKNFDLFLVRLNEFIKMKKFEKFKIDDISVGMNVYFLFFFFKF